VPVETDIHSGTQDGLPPIQDYISRYTKLVQETLLKPIPPSTCSEKPEQPFPEEGTIRDLRQAMLMWTSPKIVSLTEELRQKKKERYEALTRERAAKFEVFMLELELPKRESESRSSDAKLVRLRENVRFITNDWTEDADSIIGNIAQVSVVP